MLKGFKTTCLAYLHSRNFNLQVKLNLRAELKKCQVAPPGFEPGTFYLPGRCANHYAMV